MIKDLLLSVHGIFSQSEQGVNCCTLSDSIISKETYTLRFLNVICVRSLEGLVVINGGEGWGMGVGDGNWGRVNGGVGGEGEGCVIIYPNT